MLEIAGDNAMIEEEKGKERQEGREEFCMLPC